MQYDRKIIDDLSLTVEAGEIFGFVGPNGAGKTATIRIMATLLALTHGDVLIDGHSVKSSPKLVRNVIGYVPEVYGFYPDMTVWEYLDFFGAANKIHHRQRSDLISALLELVDLSDQIDAQVEALSLGMKQRLSLSRALLHDPKVLILDNPLSGLDPNARSEFQELLCELAQMGKAIFLSSNILADVTRICNRVGVMDAGKLVAYGSIRELESQIKLSRTIRIRLSGNPENIQTLLGRNPYVSDISTTEDQTGNMHTIIQIKFSGDDEKVIELLSVLIRLGFHVLSFEVDGNKLENIFLYITKGSLS
jgi:ABC-2 type transport system ATP-binding protein